MEQLDMRLIGKNKLLRLMEVETNASIWIRSWVSELQGAVWKQPEDVLLQFPSAHFKSSDAFDFYVSDTSLALETLIFFPQQITLITNIKSRLEK